MIISVSLCNIRADLPWKWLTVGLLFCLAGTVSGAQPVAGNNTPQEEAVARTEHFRVPFLTVRNRTGSNRADDYFGGKRDRLRAGYCEVSGKPMPVLQSLSEEIPFYVPEDILSLDRVTEKPVKPFWQAFRQSSGKRAPILYTHGFYISFDRGCRRAAEFQRNLKREGSFVLFSWPSDGVIVNYTQDEADMYWSVKPLKALIDAYYRHFGAGRANLVAHSLGTRGLLLALVRLAAEHSAEAPASPLFNQLVFIAPDIDAGIFRQYLPVIKPLARNITVYVSEHDSPLAISAQLHGYPRLGQAGAHLDGLTGIDIIDVSAVPVQYPSGHLYHLYNKPVINDIDQLLNRNLAASQRANLVRSHNRWQLVPAEKAAGSAGNTRGGEQ